MKELRPMLLVLATTLVMYGFSRLEQYKESINNPLVVFLLVFFMVTVFGFVIPKMFEPKHSKKQTKKKSDDFILPEQKWGDKP